VPAASFKRPYRKCPAAKLESVVSGFFWPGTSDKVLAFLVN